MKFTCTQCGSCCKSRADYTTVLIPRELLAEVERLTAGKNQGKKKKWSIHDNGVGDIQLGLHGVGTACPFLGPDNLCRTYQVRSEICESLPEKHAADATASARQNYAHCSAMKEVLKDVDVGRIEEAAIQGLAQGHAGGLEIRVAGDDPADAPTVCAVGDAEAGRPADHHGLFNEHQPGRTADAGAVKRRRKRIVEET